VTSTAIAVFAYRRPEHLMHVLDALAAQSNGCSLSVCLFLDGARSPAEDAAIAATRQVADNFQDRLSLQLFPSELNQGLYTSLTQGISAVLTSFDQVIVLEDDVVASPYFLDYMLQSLACYSSDPTVASVHGYVPPMPLSLPETFFLRGADCWGWATWRRSWEKVDLEMKSYTEFMRKGGARQLLKHADEARRWEKTFARYLEGRYNTWDYPLMFASWWHKQVSILPEVNLVTNIGAGAGIDQTHSFDPSVDALFHIPTQALGEIQHNPEVQVAHEADYHTFSYHIYPSWDKKLRARVWKWWRSVFRAHNLK